MNLAACLRTACETLDSTSTLAAAETKMCDGALTAFRRCVRGVAMSGKLDKYGQNEEIQKMLGDYQTVIGYGLHYGWAIEGAVGTAIKIDCSYLSPNVNLAARLESATKMYGVNILMSEYFASKLSAQVKQGLRCVDVVCLKGSSIPMAIYTCDRSNALYVSQKAMQQYGADSVIQKFDGCMTGTASWRRAMRPQRPPPHPPPPARAAHIAHRTAPRRAQCTPPTVSHHGRCISVPGFFFLEIKKKYSESRVSEFISFIKTVAPIRLSPDSESVI